MATHRSRSLTLPPSAPKVEKSPPDFFREDVDLDRVVGMFRMVADRTRLGVLRFLCNGDRTVTEICTGLGKSQPAISHHLALLRLSGLTKVRRVGKNNYYRLSGRALALVKAAIAIEEATGAGA